MTHLTDDQLRTLARPTGHLSGCTACRLRWESWRTLAAATHHAARVLTPDVPTPAFDVLLPGLSRGSEPLPDLSVAADSPGDLSLAPGSLPDLTAASDSPELSLAPGSRPDLKAASDSPGDLSLAPGSRPDLTAPSDPRPDLTRASDSPEPSRSPSSDSRAPDLAAASDPLPDLTFASDSRPDFTAASESPAADRAAASETLLPSTARMAPHRSWRASALLVWWQLRLMPRRLLPLSFAGLAAAVGIALITPDPLLASRYFAAGVVLVALLGSLATVSRRGDPRGELLFALPTSPVTVFIARLVVVLAADLLLALAGSVAVHAAGVGSGVFDLVTGWLGQSLLASAIAVAGTVRWSSGVGAAFAVAAWCLGSLTTLARGGLAERIGAAAAQIWGTTPWTLALVLLLFVLAARRLRVPEHRREFA